ncbi:hypothetical protein BXZ70DRAFT_931617 [Cristinia sonorae]|uniref:Uncharacterized protein n=1 Tax=Cristinia sonorae TaxID=1940300 RepID=A0A8K0USL0_9AGAR|nr:hypothetical protein BXZ70DRAFT_931617 [Cristinia sonorae]
MPPQRLDRQPPPRYSAAVQAYNNSLRSVIITLNVITEVWTLIWINLFQQMNIHKDHGQPKLALFALVIGILYISTTCICIFGIIAASLQREKLVKSFAFASIAGAIAVVGAGFLRVIVHFIYKNDLINECTGVVTGTGVTYRFGIWGPRIHDTLDAKEAGFFCRDGWNRDSASEIISLIAELVLSAFFIFVAFGYVKQVKQSKSKRSHAMATPGDFEDGEVTATAAGYPTHYNPPYLGYGYETAPAYAPPPGPPPGFQGQSKGLDDTSKLDDPFADFESVQKKRDSRELL